MTERTIDSFKQAYKDGSMESLSTAINRQFGNLLRECSDATNVNTLLAAILLYIEGKPKSRTEWLEKQFTGDGAGNSPFIGISQIDVKSAALGLFTEYRNLELTDNELVFMRSAIGSTKANTLFDLVKKAKKQPSPSDWLSQIAQSIIYEGLYKNTAFNMLMGQIYFGQCLDKHASVSSRYDKAYFAYNRGINTKFPFTVNTDALLKQKNLSQNGKDYVLKSVGLHSPFWFLNEYFNS